MAFLARIDRVDVNIGAICTLVPERALERADALDRGGKTLGPLHGLPIAIKDLALTRDIRTTFGSRIFSDNVPGQNDLFVDRLEAAGAVVIGKTNVPEFGAGSQTFNEVFGATHNPWDTSKTPGGSSGGAAAALAAHMLPIADGSDYGGSLRNPASFCGVVGFRPTPGRVPRVPTKDLWDDMAVLGPMARSVEDLALLFSVMAGPDKRDPITLPHLTSGRPRPGGGSSFHPLPPYEPRGKRLAWSPDLGRYPVAGEVRSVCEESLQTFESLGMEVEEAHPDLSDVEDVFQTLRAALFAGRFAPLLASHRDLVKDTMAWNIEKGLELSAYDLVVTTHKRADLLAKVHIFFEKYDFLALPTVQVLPFPVDCAYPTEINGQKLDTYLDWMGTCTAITVTRCPAISVPAGLSQQGLPVGLQLVAPSGQDLELLSLAAAFEQARPFPALPQI